MGKVLDRGGNATPTVAQSPVLRAPLRCPNPQEKQEAAGEVLAAKRSPHRPGTARALGLRAWCDGLFIISQTVCRKEITMSLASWLGFNRAALRPASAQGPRDRRRPRLHVEPLEE